MKRKSVLVLFVLGLLLATGAWASETDKAGKTHDVSATVVSVDMEAHTITFEGPDGEEMTAPVLESAQKSLEKVTAGEKVKMTCKDNEKGEHQGIVAIHAA